MVIVGDSFTLSNGSNPVRISHIANKISQNFCLRNRQLLPFLFSSEELERGR